MHKLNIEHVHYPTCHSLFSSFSSGSHFQSQQKTHCIGQTDIMTKRHIINRLPKTLLW